MFNVRGLLGHVIVLIALAPSTVCGQNEVLLSCSFEDDICNYFHRDDLGDFRWQRHEADTPSPYTGPSAAYDGRFYLYIEATHNSRGDKAMLQTLGMNYDSVICVSFAYHMFGEDIGALVVRTSGPHGERLLDKRGNQGNVWIRRTVQTTIDQRASIFFEAEKGNDYRSDIAIDQFSARKGSCDFSTCDLTNGGCEHICHPANSGRYCSCHDGFQLIGDTTCNDIDECDNNNGKCQQGCLNRIGSYYCPICSSGYANNTNGRTCDDVDECDVSNGGCQHSCFNFDGSYSCFCNQGFVLLSDGKSCADINECDISNGGCRHNCTNTDGSFTCDCDPGHQLASDGLTCNDIDECADESSGCAGGCLNTLSSYLCICDPGQVLGADKHSCQGCGAEYRQIIESSQAFTSSCPIADELLETDLDSCLKRACGGATVNMLTYRNRVCGLRSCLPGEYQLEAFAGSQGWDIYVRNTTEQNGGPGDREETVPVWQVSVGVVVGVVALAAVAVGATVALRRRRQPPSPSTPGEPAHYENEPVTTLPGDRSDDRTTRDSTVYEDIKELGAEAMDKREGKASAKIKEDVLYQNETFQYDCGYQDLAPTESHASEPYQAIQ